MDRLPPPVRLARSSRRRPPTWRPRRVSPPRCSGCPRSSPAPACAVQQPGRHGRSSRRRREVHAVHSRGNLERHPVREGLVFQVLTGPPTVGVGGRSVDDVDSRNEVRAFLASRRARLTPQEAGLPVHGRNRRVIGLRREEAALLAGLSVDYYTRLERGHLKGASESVLHALAGGLQLDEAERAHLFDLARAANPSGSKPRRPASQKVRPGVQRVLDAITGAPAWVRTSVWRRRWRTWPPSASCSSVRRTAARCSPNSYRLRWTAEAEWSSSRPKGCWPSATESG